MLISFPQNGLWPKSTNAYTVGQKPATEDAREIFRP